MKCECCGLREDCTQEYISSVKANFDGKWLCGLCAEAVRDEAVRGKRSKGFIGVEDAVGAHMSFRRNSRSNPAVHVAEGMRQMLRRRSSDLTVGSGSAAVKKFGRSLSTLK